MDDEFLDITDEDGAPTGIVKTRKEIHRLGLTHRTVHVWIITPEGQLLLQRRARQKETFAGFWDISAAGHIGAGDEPQAAAIRETAEELGIIILPEVLKFVFKVRQRFDSEDGCIKEDECCFVYCIKQAIDPADVKPQTGEVDETILLPWREFKKHIDTGDRDIVPHGEEYKLLFEHLEREGF